MPSLLGTNCLLRYPDNIRIGTLLQRVKRFSVECLINGERIWAHTNNSGSMLGLIRAGMHVLLSPAANKNRKLPYTLEAIGTPDLGGKIHWIGVNTLVPNKLLQAAFEAGQLEFARSYSSFKAEARRGQSRIDALLTGELLPPFWVECKNVTLVENEIAAFPDAVTTRGQKHIQELINIVESGERAAFFYCVQRGDARCFGPADYIDPAYAELFYTSIEKGVEVYAYEAEVTLDGIALKQCLPLAPLPCYKQ